MTCPGCGAFTQPVEPDEAGYYSATRTNKEFVKQARRKLAGETLDDVTQPRTTDEITASATSAPDAPSLSTSQAVRSKERRANAHFRSEPSSKDKAVTVPFCDRCNDILYHGSGRSVHHPSVESIQKTILESPHKYNHIYHVLDAADFPMSLVPRLNGLLNLSRQRTRNRRSKAGRFIRGRRDEMSFIITRSDLLAPAKEQVDKLMPYLREVLRDALARADKNIRLGNVRCVSAKRGWWTKDLKEEIWNRGGGGWMVGRVNVGKSHLFDSVFPKGRGLDLRSMDGTDEPAEDDEADHVDEQRLPTETKAIHADPELDPDSLLPPLPLETPYPVMPLVSSLPGTTASPIRHSFGTGKGELVDLPGLSRGGLEDFVRPEHRRQLVMNAHVKPAQLAIKPGQSLLLGGLIRITHQMRDTVLLACPFVPLHAHVTSTSKATAIQAQTGPSGVTSIASPGMGDQVRLAGEFSVRWDVTKSRAGPLTSPSAVGLKADRLPFIVLGTDILIEGCGWVELAVQVRRRQLEQALPFPTTEAAAAAAAASSSSGENVDGHVYPKVEVYSPRGEFIGQRRPMNAWLLSEAHRKSTAVVLKRRQPQPIQKTKKKNEMVVKMAA